MNIDDFLVLCAMFQIPVNGGGGGSVVTSVNGQTGTVVLNTEDIPESGDNLFYTDARAELKEDVANKSTDVNLGSSNIDYPTQNAVKTYVDNAVVGLLDDRGNYDASSNLWPATGGSGVGGTILKGNLWFISVPGTLGGVAVQIGYSIRALINSPGQTSSNWDILNVGIGYTPENVANKSINTSLGTSDTLYPTQKATKTYVDTALTSALAAYLTKANNLSDVDDAAAARLNLGIPDFGNTTATLSLTNVFTSPLSVSAHFQKVGNLVGMKLDSISHLIDSQTFIIIDGIPAGFRPTNPVTFIIPVYNPVTAVNQGYAELWVQLEGDGTGFAGLTLSSANSGLPFGDYQVGQTFGFDDVTVTYSL
jgi:hypothetical protein